MHPTPAIAGKERGDYQIGMIAFLARMAVAQDRGPHYRHDGTTYWFCSVGCRDEFAADPDHFTGETPSRATASPPG